MRENERMIGGKPLSHPDNNVSFLKPVNSEPGMAAKVVQPALEAGLTAFGKVFNVFDGTRSVIGNAAKRLDNALEASRKVAAEAAQAKWSDKYFAREDENGKPISAYEAFLNRYNDK